ncbi:MAG: riboflavin biosynthesis protein RibF [Ruminiclostridium sp.]|nr:riboflavin biosynthesis protein RibF [Ruminiclostridium sp.]
MTDKEKTAVALGFFDGMHIGHQAVISAARAAAEKNGYVPSAFMIREKPRLPKFGGRIDVFITPYDTKVSVFKNDFGIREIYAPFFEAIKDLSPEEFFSRDLVGVLNAAYVVCGEDFRFGKDRAGDVSTLDTLCKRAGIGFEAVPPVCVNGEEVSSTMLRELIRSGDVKTANELMLRPLTYTLPVVHGREIGRSIGFPTINQEIRPFMVRPKRGVYASEVNIEGIRYTAITNIGTKPTVKSDDTENMETHIIGFEDDLYRQEVSVTILSYIRGECKFSSLDALKAQLEADRNSVLTQK